MKCISSSTRIGLPISYGDRKSLLIDVNKKLDSGIGGSKTWRDLDIDENIFDDWNASLAKLEEITIVVNAAWEEKEKNPEATLWHLAARYNKTWLISQFLKDPIASKSMMDIDSFGKMPLDVAIECGSEEVTNMLQAQIAKMRSVEYSIFSDIFDLTIQKETNIDLAIQAKEVLIGCVVRYDFGLLGWSRGTTAKKGWVHRYQLVTHEILREMGVLSWQSAITTPQEWLLALLNNQNNSNKFIVENHLARLENLELNILQKNPSYEHFQSLEKLDELLFILHNLRITYRGRLLNACTKLSSPKEDAISQKSALPERVASSSLKSRLPQQYTASYSGGEDYYSPSKLQTKSQQAPTVSATPRPASVAAPKPAVPPAAVTPKASSSYVESSSRAASYSAHDGYYSTSKSPAKPQQPIPATFVMPRVASVVAPKAVVPPAAASKPSSSYNSSQTPSYSAHEGYYSTQKSSTKPQQTIPVSAKVPAKPAAVTQVKPASVYAQPARAKEKTRSMTSYYSYDDIPQPYDDDPYFYNDDPREYPDYTSPTHEDDYSGNYVSPSWAYDNDDYVYYASAPVKQTASVAKQPAPASSRHSSTYTHQRSSSSFSAPRAKSSSSYDVASTTRAFGDLSFDEAPLHSKSVPSTKKSTSTAKTQTIPVAQIRFSQASVSDIFTDGNLLSDLVTQLVNGEIRPDEIEPIRVVKYNSKWHTLDNRRLRAFKNALVENIPVILCDLSDPAIKKEFYGKYSNKSLNAGGAIRSSYSSAVPSRDHFDSGIFVFNKRVLSWTFEQIAVKLPSLARTGAIPKQFSSREEYYASFEELIFEEARAVLQAGLDEAALQEESPYKFRLENCKLPKKADGITTLTLSFLSKSERESKPGEVILLEHTKNPRLRLIALRSGKESAEDHLSFKAVINEEFLESYPDAFDEGARWNAKLLGSLISHQRMYEACTTLPLPTNPETVLERSLWTGTSQEKSAASIPTRYAPMYGEYESYGMDPYDSYSIRSSSLAKSSVSKSSHNTPSAHEEIFLQKLNPSQRSAVEKFLPLEEGIQLIQGPPGTGKTSTIVQLLKILCKRKQRILVSAPSNKAVQVVAEKFIAEYPDVPVAYAGVEEKLSDDIALQRVFIHTWGVMMCDRLTEINENLLDLLPEKLVVSGLIQLPNNIADASEALLDLSEEFISLIDEMARYKLSFLLDAERQKEVFQSNIQAYIDLLSNYPSNSNTWKEVKNYLDILAASKSTKHKKGVENTEIRSPDLPYLSASARRLFSAITSQIDTLKRAIALLDMNETKTGLEGQLLDNSRIVFATLTVLGRRAFKEMDSVDALIVDEAGQCVEAETLIALVTHPKKCLLIGDIKQLPATVISQHAVELNFGRSLMERLGNLQKKYPMLEIQYRMNPAISVWPAQQYYEGRLRDDPSTLKRVLPELKGAPPFFAPYSFINVEGEEDTTPSGYSFINEAEAEQIDQLLKHLKENYNINVSERVGVITFYRGQADYLREKLSRKFPDIQVNTVDGFQGGENDFIIMSFVRANPKGTIGFVKDMRRLNVALTRAKYSLIMVGNAYTLQRGHHDVALLITDAYKRGCFFYQSDVVTALTPKVKIKTVEKVVTEDRFISPPAISSRAASTLSLEATSSASSSAVQKQAPKKSDHKTNPCRFFNGEPNSCRRGNKCKFEHAENKIEASTTKIPAQVEQIPSAMPAPEIVITSSKASSPSAEKNARKHQGQRSRHQPQESSAQLLGKSLGKSALASTTISEKTRAKTQPAVGVARPKPY